MKHCANCGKDLYHTDEVLCFACDIARMSKGTSHNSLRDHIRDEWKNRDRISVIFYSLALLCIISLVARWYNYLNGLTQ